MIEKSDIDQSELKGVPGPYNDEDPDLTTEIWTNLKQSRNHHSQSRSYMVTAYDFYASRQLSEEDKMILLEQGRPVVCFNRIPRTINAVCGLEVQGRKEPRCLPVEIENSGGADYGTGILKAVRQKSDAEDEDSQAFQDSTICGYGWTESYTKVEGMNPVILVSCIDPKEMLYDHMSKKSNLVDVTWVARIKEMTRKQFLRDFPGEEFVPYSFWGSSVDDQEPHDATNAWKYDNDQSDRVTQVKTCSVIQYQYWEMKSYYAVVTPDGNIVEFDEKKYNKIKKNLQMNGLTSLKLEKKVFKQCILTKNKIINQVDLETDTFTFQAITGYHDRERNVFFGLVQLMMDPQRWANKWLSQIMHIVNSGAKNGLIVEENVLKNPRKVEREWSRPGSITEVQAGALTEGRLQQKQPPQYPDGIDRLLQYAVGAIQDVVGVNLELLGMADRDQAWGLEESRKKAGITMLATFFDSLRRYRKNNARVLMSLIRNYLPEGTLVRIAGQQGAKYEPFLKDKLAFEYDIMIDDAPSSPDMKERVFNVLTQLIPMALQAGIPIPPDVLDWTPLPEDLAQKWKDMITSGQNNPQQQQQQQMQQVAAQLDLQQKQSDIKKTESEVVANYAKAEQYHGVGQDEQALAMQKTGAANSEYQIKSQQMMAEQQRKDYEMLLNQHRKQAEMAMNTNLKAQQQAHHQSQQMQQQQWQQSQPQPTASTQ